MALRPIKPFVNKIVFTNAIAFYPLAKAEIICPVLSVLFGVLVYFSVRMHIPHCHDIVVGHWEPILRIMFKCLSAGLDPHSPQLAVFNNMYQFTPFQKAVKNFLSLYSY